MIWCAWCVAGALVFFAPARGAWGQAYDPEDAAIRQLRKATSFSPTGVHHAVLLALRDLRDPAMKPFFQALVQADHLSIQLGAILGLAELSPDGRVDPWLISRLRTDADRADAVRIALDLERLGREEVEALLAASDMPSVARVVLLAELRRLGGRPDVEALRHLAENADPTIAALATSLLAEVSDPTDATARAAMAACVERVRSLPPRQRDAVIEELAAAGRRYGVRSAIGLIADATRGAEPSTAARDAALALALSLDPEQGVVRWQESLGQDPSLASRVRHGLLLLVVASRVPPEAFDLLTRGLDRGADDSALLVAMADAGRALASRSGQVAALQRLYDIGHRRSCRFVIAAAEQLEDPEATEVYRHILDQSQIPARRSRELFNDCVDVAARMADRDPKTLGAILRDTPDDQPVQDAILMGLANARSPAASEIAASVPRIGAGRSDSLALLVLARRRESLSPAEMAQLGRMAGGGGRLDDTLQAQAAWLWLRNAGRLDAALPKILTGIGGASDGRAEAGAPAAGSGR